MVWLCWCLGDCTLEAKNVIILKKGLTTGKNYELWLCFVFNLLNVRVFYMCVQCLFLIY